MKLNCHKLSQLLGQAAVALLLAAGAAEANKPAARLAQLNVEPGSITVSGISSGGYMAHQFHVAYALTVDGAGVIAGGPYQCATATSFGQADPGLPAPWNLFSLNADVVTIYQAFCRCMSVKGGAPDVDRLYNRYSIMEKTNKPDDEGVLSPKIDTPQGLDGDKVFILAGTDDLTVDPAVGNALEQFYRKIATEEGIDITIETNYEIAASHAFPTLTQETGSTCSRQCSTNEKPLCDMFHGASPAETEGETVCNYINDCDYDTAGTLFGLFYGATDAGTVVPENLFEFDQTEFIEAALGRSAPRSLSLADYGHIYIPTTCQHGERCKLHVSFHGCKQGDDAVAAEYPAQTGYNRWAEANNIIVLYPRAVPYAPPWLKATLEPTISNYVAALNPAEAMTAAFSMREVNPNGCWDWWGYTNSATYSVKTAPQMKVIKCMIDRLRGKGNPACVAG